MTQLNIRTRTAGTAGLKTKAAALLRAARETTRRRPDPVAYAAALEVLG